MQNSILHIGTNHYNVFIKDGEVEYNACNNNELIFFFMNNTVYYVWLSQLFKCGSDKPNEILLRYDNPQDFYNLNSSEMLQLGFLTEAEVYSIKKTSLMCAEAIMEDCKNLGIRVVSICDDDYPVRLKYIYGPPVVLYVKGDIIGLDDELVLTVVGTRNPSEYGEYTATRISGELAAAGAVIVSGCAVGIDAAAHTGAIKAGKRTIAVLGCGLDIDYPYQNHHLKEMILKKGALISEMPPKSKPEGYIFPIRNRIMSGLSDGVVVIEAPTRSGSLITAEHAIEQGKDLFMLVPANIYNSKFMGVARYIRDGAIPIMSSQDVLLEYYNKYTDKLDALKILGEYQLTLKKEKIETAVNNPKSNVQQKEDEVDSEQNNEQIAQIVADMDELQLKVYNTLSLKPRYIDEIVADSGITMNQVLAIVTELEITGAVTSYSGRRYGKL